MALECAILGDSIAVGVAQHQKYCYRDAIVGINSHNFAKRITTINADHVLISLGSNDSAKTNTDWHLLQIRASVAADTVTWLLSANNASAHAAAKKVAEMFHDRVIEVKPFVGYDGVHSTITGYRSIADLWLKK